MKKIIATLIFTFLLTAGTSAQDPHRFDEAIEKFAELAFPEGTELSVFTGSSSIRFWEDLEMDCEGAQVVNTGFGGSQMTDLLYFLDETVLRFNASKVYIYEGDNDIAEGKDPKDILKSSKEVTEKILEKKPDTKIYFISAKPSPSRWAYKEEYIAFNSLLKNYCENEPQLTFLDVWNPMLNDRGRPIPTIFVEDSLHMNRLGYLLWKEIICSTGE